MPTLTLKSTHKPVQQYFESLNEFDRLGVKHEGAVRSAFHELLEHCARQFDWKLVPAYRTKGRGKAHVVVDGALLDTYGLVHGHWEAKDSDDDLDKEIKAKFSVGYPKENIIFQEPKRAVLYQNGERYYEADLTKPEDLVHVLTLFLEFAPPAIAEWEKAVDEFREKVPQLGASLSKLIKKERQTNPRFKPAFTDFLQLCRASLNPNLSEDAVEEMIIQHLLTERIFRKIFSAADFIQRNVIAQEIEKVIAALTSKAFSRDDFLKSLDHFYVAVEHAADTIKEFSEKQKFLNTVYERFFQGFSVKVADTHGIVYTPQPLVNFMVNSVEHLLKTEFGKSLADKDVHVLDPFTGTGNFIVNLMRLIPRSALPHKYRHELHCNEVMLLPYYVAAMNIEHEFFEAVRKYEPFEGICLVDTFQTMEPPQAEFSFFTEKNAERVERQKKSPIRVIIANPPYNAWQQDEMDNNRNRKYPYLDKRVKETYSDDSAAQNKNSLSDPYIKAFRYACDKIEEDGVIAYVSNNGFLASMACDGMRKHLVQDFDAIYHLDLKGNARTSGERRRQEAGNVFNDQIRVGIGVTFLVRKRSKKSGVAKVFVHRVDDYLRSDAKQAILENAGSLTNIPWKRIRPDRKNNWLTEGIRQEFDEFLPIGDRDALLSSTTPPVFRHYSRGIATSRDFAAVNFRREKVSENMQAMISAYNGQVDSYHRLKKRPKNVEDFIDYDSKRIAWSRDLKNDLLRHRLAEFSEEKLRPSFYRPFTATCLFFDRVMNEEVYGFPEIFSDPDTENSTICLTDAGSEKPFMTLASDRIVDLHLVGAGSSSQCFPLYTYSEDGNHRQDNVTLQALTRFQIFYDDDSITRQDIFHYVYALLHHPAYRSRYAENLKRELPRIPFVAADGSLHGPPEPGKESDHKPSKKDAAVFHAFAKAGEKLADLHVNYEAQKEFKLQRIENKSVPLDWRVEVMKLTKDRASLIYNDFLTLSGIPSEVFDYKLGNRSALEWVIDQYRVTRDAHGQITSDPNRDGDEQYIARLIGQVIMVSLETLCIIKGLPPLDFS